MVVPLGGFPVRFVMVRRTVARPKSNENALKDPEEQADASQFKTGGVGRHKFCVKNKLHVLLQAFKLTSLSGAHNNFSDVTNLLKSCHLKKMPRGGSRMKEEVALHNTAAVQRALASEMPRLLSTLSDPCLSLVREQIRQK